jgi:hypothetical protein
MFIIKGIFGTAWTKATGGGLGHMLWEGVDMLSKMWLITVTQYQYRHGGSFVEIVCGLYAEGGIQRFYCGILPALLQGPTIRFLESVISGSTRAILDQTVSPKFPMSLQNIVASMLGSSANVILAFIDTWKCVQQVGGEEGMKQLAAKAKTDSTAPWHGAGLAMVARNFRSYRWFLLPTSCRK